MRKLLLILLLIPLSLSAQFDYEETLIARTTGKKIMANNDTVRVMGFALSLLDNPNVPGPTLEFNEGDSVHIDLWNVSQNMAHTIHLHGLDVDQQNDGVPHLSFDVLHMDHGHYYMKAPHAGTYLYHCHVVSSIHVQAGMYGLIIVHPPDGSQKTWDGGYDYDVSMPLMFSEIDTVWHNDTLIQHDHDTSFAVHSVAVPDYHPQFYLINGFSDGQLIDTNFALNTSVDAVNYMRLANIGYKGIRVIFPPDFDAEIVASDGRPLPVTEINDTVYVYPGERYGVLGSMPAEGTDQISVEYFDLNTGALENTQVFPINVSGFINIPEEEKGELTVMPNPSNGDFTLALTDFKNAQVAINLVGLNGRLLEQIFPTTLVENDVYINYSNSKLAQGIYILELQVDGVVRSSSKLIISK